nr:MAG TPA: hypothetical protein [Caudoviricetes sp.]DAU37205.1 MAG TPA: hypothetical protein [Caudoviricetes sp.]DAY46299.1 MAG TPA: hypothetical protein [Caudoviricetes sp.]
MCLTDLSAAMQSDLQMRYGLLGLSGFIFAA